MDAATIYNYFEVFLWLVFALVFFVPACRRGEKNRLFCICGGLIFVWASLSEYYEVQTGAWWTPWWMLCWKISFIVPFVLMLFWYLKINPTMKLFSKKFEDSEKPD